LFFVWKDENKGLYSPFYIKLRKATDNEYYFRRAEIFARIFESYVSMKLTNAGIQNDFLTKRKYSAPVYPTPGELRKIEPYLDKLLEEMRRYF
jgi:hypothetical protein